MIYCHKCGTANEPVADSCMKCERPLLQLGRGIFKVPMHVAYTERARRHVGLDAGQAITDFARALESAAPDKVRAALLSERATVLEKLERYEEARADLASAVEVAPPTLRPDLLLRRIDLDERVGASDDETRDRLTYTYAAQTDCYLAARFDPDKYKTGLATALLGEGFNVGRATADRNVFFNELASMRQTMIAEGKATVRGYCPVCRSVVEPTEGRCPNVPLEAETHRERRAKKEHEKLLTRVRVVMPDQVEQAAADLLAKH